ncbi:unnamed protein product [Brachionus calyciflorus]|uniref:Uncharacterized protein n=1 Tax=Brachionus calyciflorus TaxID=104777 RepID=A0A813RS49_9BILA|nr:unnamed protein product [Brachionus calyciflorus]
MAESEVLSELTKSHLSNLKNLTFYSQNKRVKEYFDFLKNSNDSRECLKEDEIKRKKLKLNEKVVEQQQANKAYEINWNLEYCEKCMLSYWPNNCTVYVLPKYHMRSRHAKLNRKLKLFDYKPKLDSFKDKVIKNAIYKGIELIYECKRCNYKNIIVNEIKRQNLKCLKSTKTLNEKKFKQDLSKSSLKFNSKIHAQNVQSEKPTIIKSNAIKKKFQSLQLKLKQNEIDQEKLKSKTTSSFGSLADFLEKLN